MFSISNLSDNTVEFLTECEYGDCFREIKKLPRKYRWLKSLMRIDGEKIAKELTYRDIAIVSTNGQVLVNMTKLEELKELIEKLESDRMACYAEIEYYDGNDEKKRVLIKLDNKEHREYVIWRFGMTAGSDERIRRLTREEARKEYDISRFNKLPYADIFVMANPDRPGTNWRFDAIEPTRKADSSWVTGQGRGTQMTLLTDGE